MSNSTNPKLTDVNQSLNNINKDGQAVIINYPLFSVTGHIQGIASKGDNIYISQNVTPAIDVFSIDTKEHLNRIKLDTDLPHYSAIQKVGDYLAVAIEPEDGTQCSEIRFIDLINNKEIPELTLYRKNGKAGAVGISNYTHVDGTEHMMLVVHDNSKLDFYDRNGLLSDSLLQFEYVDKYKLPVGYDCIALIVDTKQQLFLLGFHTEDFGATGKNNDFIDLYGINTLGGITCDLIHEKIHFITHGAPVGILGPHFRYAGGIEVTSDLHVRILASSRGEGEINVNLFEYWIADFSATDSGKRKGTTEALSPEGLEPGAKVSINGSTDLSTCIVGEDKAKVYSITLERSSHYVIYEYKLIVIAQGPDDLVGTLDLNFTDQSGDTYALSIFDSSKKEHTVDYNSKNPGITKISWS